MEWLEVLEDKSLRDLPYKIELNEYGNILMSPASNKHALLQVKAERLLWQSLQGGESLVECSIQTSKGVRVADVVWCSDEFLSVHDFETPYTKAPEICVEIISPSNNNAEMMEKIALYLEAGAQEVCLISDDASVSIHNNEGSQSLSHFSVDVKTLFN